MSSAEPGPSAFFSKRVYWTVIPLLALAMFVTTAVAGIPGIFLLKDAVGPDRIGYVYVSYGIIAGSTIVLECLFFYTGIYLVWKLTKRIASLTFATLGEEFKAENRASWTWVDVVASTVVVSIVIACYIYFWNWLGQ